MDNKQSEASLKHYAVVDNSPRMVARFYLVAGIGVCMEGMDLFFLAAMSMDGNTEWTSELVFYVALALVLPVIISVLGVIGARKLSHSHIYFDSETIIADLKFHKTREIKWSQLGGFIKTQTRGIVLVDKMGKMVIAADATMPNYYAFYNMAIRKCKDYRQEKKKEKTGTFVAKEARLGVDSFCVVSAFILGMGISILIMAGIVELQQQVREAQVFFETFPVWGYAIIMASFPAIGLGVTLPLWMRRYWKYSDTGLEIYYVSGKKVQLSWGQIRKVDVTVIKSPGGEHYGFVLYTAWEQYQSGNLLTKGNHDFMLQVERMAEIYGFEVSKTLLK